MTDSSSDTVSQIAIPQSLQRVLPRTISGAVSAANSNAIDWGWQGFIAYGVQSAIVIVDPSSIQCAQTLTKHQSSVVKVRWRNTKHYHTLSAPYTLVLASADTSGTIYIWDVAKGETVSTLYDGNRPILELAWLGTHDGSEYLLAALHPPYSLVLWDTRHGSKVWKKSYTENLFSFSFDPFHLNKMAFLCQGCILFVDDFGISKCPSSNGQRFFVSMPSSPSHGTSSTGNSDEKTSTLLRNKMRQLVAGDVKPKAEDSAQMSECVQLLYHQSCHDLLILVFAREVLLIDLLIKQTVGVIAPDRNMASIIQVVSCWQRDAIFCLHESGSVSGHFRRRSFDQNKSQSADNIPGQIVDIFYEKKCYSEPLRLGRGKEPLGLCMNPATEKHFGFFLGPGDSRLVFKELFMASSSLTKTCESSCVSRKEDFIEKTHSTASLSIRDDHFSPEFSTLTSNTFMKMPNISISQFITPVHEVDDSLPKERFTFRILMTGLLPCMLPATTIRMCPPLTTKNINTYVPFMATGTHGGEVQIINLATGILERDFSLHTCPVRGIEWTALTSLLSFGHQLLTNAQGRVRNELIHTDVRTGYSLALRTNRTEESPIEMIRVSYLKQYFFVILTHDPVELWDCNTLTPLRTMSRKFPRVSALEWSPTTNMRPRKDSASSVKESDHSEDASPGAIPDDSLSTSLKSSTWSLQESAEESTLVKETMVFTGLEGQLYHFSVKGNILKDGTRIPPDTQRNSITFIAWKSQRIVLSDADGSISIWDLKSRAFRTINTHRGYIKKMRFAPGKDNMKILVLYKDGIDIWNVKEIILLAQLKSPKDCVEVVDVDWGASDSPVIAFVDGSLKVMDIQLKKAHSPISHYYNKDPVVSPYLLTAEASLNLRTLMTHQPWRSTFSLRFSTEDGFTCSQLDAINMWLSRLPTDVCLFLEQCDSVMYRAFITAYLFGDRGEIDFWSVATYYLSVCISGKKIDSKEHNLLDFTQSEVEKPRYQFIKSINSPLLDSSFYHLCNNTAYKCQELERLLVHENKYLSQVMRETLGRKLAVVGEKDRVVRILLDADSSNPQFYTDCLRACLLSATHHSTQAQSTIKLVATNLIAAGNIYEGIELLCLIGKAADACRYLQSHGYWDDSIWLAKCVLPRSEAFDLMKRWAHHLINSGNKDMAVCAYVASGLTSSAVEQLVLQHYHQRAALLLEALHQIGLLSPISSSEVSAPHPIVFIVPSMKENIYRKYVLFLFGLSNSKAVEYYCQEMGESGKELQKDLASLNGFEPAS